MSSLGLVWVVVSVAISTVCGLGVGLCREIMLEDVQRRLPEGEKIKFPYLSYKYPQILSLHAEFYPESRIRAVSRFLTWVALSSIGSLGVIALAIVIFKGAQQH